MATKPPSERTRTLTLPERLLLAGVSNSCGASVTNPIDVIKVRLQLQGELAAAGSGPREYRSVLGGLAHIVRQEGLGGLFRGVAPAVLREMTYSAIRLGLYEPFKDLLGGTDVHHTPLWIKIAAGAASGTIGAAVANPTDLIKIRMQADRTGTKYRSLLDCATQIVSREGGVRALWQGVGPTVQRAAILTATQVPSYDHLKHHLLNEGLMREGLPLHIIASTFAGLTTAIVTSPVDLIKTRVMNQGSAGGAPRYRSALHCAVETVKAEGVAGLYKGFFPNWLRIAPHTTVSLMVFEGIRAHLGVPAM